MFYLIILNLIINKFLHQPLLQMFNIHYNLFNLLNHPLRHLLKNGVHGLSLTRIKFLLIIYFLSYYFKNDYVSLVIILILK